VASIPLLTLSSLSYNDLGPEGGRALGEALLSNTTLTTLQ
jgi:hypothetical protein